jgi:hypothetical protein
VSEIIDYDRDINGHRRARCLLCGRMVVVCTRPDDTRWRYSEHKPPSRPPGDEENCDNTGELVPAVKPEARP